MKRYLLLILICTSAIGYANNSLTWLQKRRARNGLPSKVTFKICDTAGLPISNATVSAFYQFSDSHTIYEKTTSIDGQAVFENRCMNSIEYSILCNGFYGGRGAYSFFKTRAHLLECIKADRWEPWNPTISLTLREQRSPTNAPIHWIYRSGLKPHITYEFDLAAHDFLPPTGKGEHADFQFVCDWEKFDTGVMDMKYVSTISMTNCDDGFITFPKYGFSDQKFPYEAPIMGYTNQLVFSRVQQNSFRQSSKFDAKNDCILYRVRSSSRTKQDQVANYGLIVDFRLWCDRNGSVSFDIAYYYNETPNDRNTEYAYPWMLQ